jgi:hypothetical protein
MSDAQAKLTWAETRHEEMQRLFADFAKPGGGDERPYAIRFHTLRRPSTLVVARFGIDEPMPVEMSLLAADLVHNTRVALDHVLARLKEQLGGDVGHGSFPICLTDDDWQCRVSEPQSRRSPLEGLPAQAVELIYNEQPLHHEPAENDPLVILNKLDNADKHRLLQHSYFYPGVQRGLDLIEAVASSRVISAENRWVAGDPLENGTVLARFMIRGDAAEVLRAHDSAPVGFASGETGTGRTGYTEMIERVRTVTEHAEDLLGG